MTQKNGSGHGDVHFLRQVTVVIALLLSMVVLFHFERFAVHRFDPTGMLALGFIVLASYAIGELAGQIRLPHITGYLLAGLIFGPSLPQVLGWSGLPAPFDRGVLNKEVIDQLSLIDTLAVALIALTAGGEIKLESLRKGSRAIVSILGMQLVCVIGAMILFFAFVSGIPQLAMPGMDAMSMPVVVTIGGMVGIVAFATSPAATIAVIMETKSSGPMTRTLLSTVVLKDVVVVIMFAAVQMILAQHMGMSNPEKPFPYLLQHIVFPIVVGAVIVGGAINLYVRYVNQELLVFVVGTVYLVAYIVMVLQWEPILVFLAAGFGISNFSKNGHRLIETVERLSLPVYVVFFTLAGAKLHLDELQQVTMFALALVGVRLISMSWGTKLGARLGAADEATQRFGWMGFISQAGISISLAAIIGSRFGELGKSLETLIIGGVAIHELIGPVLLKVALTLSGETKTRKRPNTSFESLVIRSPSFSASGTRKSTSTTKLEPWFAPSDSSVDLWPPPVQTQSPKLNASLHDLAIDLQLIVRTVSTGPLREFHSEAERYLRDLRREFLRHHRKLVVRARLEDSDQRQELATMLRTTQAELAAHWRGIVVGRSVMLSKKQWTPAVILEDLDMIVEELPTHVIAPYEPRTYESQENDSSFKSLQRYTLRCARAWRRTFGQPVLQRHVRLQSLGRYHLSYRVPSKLESIAALIIEADRHLAMRTSSIFESITQGYDDIADALGDVNSDLNREMTSLKAEVEEEFMLALEETTRITQDGTRRVASALGSGYVGMKEDVCVFGTLDLPNSGRRTSHKFGERMHAMEALTKGLANLRKVSAAQHSMLAMDLELLGLQAKVKEIVEQYMVRISKMIKRRAMTQANRVSKLLAEAVERLNYEMEQNHSGQELAKAIRHGTEQVGRETAEAARVVIQLYQDLADDSKITPLLDELVDTCRGLTPRYRVTLGQWKHSEWRLPDVLPEIDVPFREVVLTYIDSRAVHQLLKVRRELAVKVQPLANLLQELERLVAFNVELSTADLELVHDEHVPGEMDSLLRDMVVGQFERSYGHLQNLQESSKLWLHDHNALVREATLGTLTTLREQLSEGRLDRSQLGAMRRATSDSRMVEHMPGHIRTWKTQIDAWLRVVFGEDKIDRWHEQFGLFASASDDALCAGSFAEPKVATDMPLVYRRLFAADTLEAGDVLTGRTNEIHRAETMLTSEVEGRLRSVALVGVDGVGKSAVVSAIVRSRRWKNVRRVAFHKPVTVEDVQAIFQDSAEGQLVVVDGLRWMLSLAPGGFEPLRRFVAGIISEGGRRRWLTHGDALFWNFASTVAPLRDAFPEVIRLNPLGARELQEAVIARHRLSGYEHEFDRGNGSVFERMFARGTSRIRRPYDQYFEELHAATGGLVRDALRLWLASIKEVQAAEIVRVGRVPASSYSKLKRLPEDILINLYQVARQGWIDAAGQARLFRIDTNTAHAQLSRLAHLALLREQDGVFEISLHLRGALGRFFAARGWVQ